MTSTANGHERPGATARRLVDAVGTWCALGYAYLAFLAKQPGEPDLPVFFILVAWTGLPVFGLYRYFRRHGEPFPLGRMIFWAVIFRICGLIGGPFFEDDFNRYLWDGYRFATSGTPLAVRGKSTFHGTIVLWRWGDVSGGNGRKICG